MRGTTWLVICLALTACSSDVDDVTGVGTSGARRLSRNEYDTTLRDLLLDESRSGFAKLPEDVNDPFDNDYTTQQPSGVLVEAAETLAGEAAARLLADPAKRDQVVGCTPTAPDDAACLRSFVTHFGRLALRRPLTTEEIDQLLTFGEFALEGNDFYIAVGMVVSTLLQHPEFLYRVEIGRPVSGRPGLYRLTDHEVGTRLSYFIWGSTPDDALLDLADARKLSTPEAVRAAATRLLADPRARARVDRFHALWLGYHQLPHSADLTTAMRTETGALIDRVVFDERRPWTDVFTSDETYVDATLAELYGLPAPAEGFAWTPYPAGTGERRGILAHGSFLSVAGKFGDTSPTQRGKLIRERLLCESIPPPPPNVNVDQPPESPTSTCKYDRYEAHRANGSCSGCHSQMDPVGFGLENFDQTGRFRTHDNGDTSCTIAGDGLLFGLGEGGTPLPFHGPGELAAVLVESGRLEQCLVTQVYRFAVGHREAEADAPYLAALAGAFATTHRFDDLILELVTAEQFGYRQEE
jgi:hypothetical protein